MADGTIFRKNVIVMNTRVFSSQRCPLAGLVSRRFAMNVSLNALDRLTCG